jgi:hypothetical protein
MLRNIRFSLLCLKGKIFITAGHRPAAGSKALLNPAFQAGRVNGCFPLRRSKTCGYENYVLSGLSEMYVICYFTHLNQSDADT